MEILQQPKVAQGIRFSIQKDGIEVARAYLYLMHNDLHQEPFGLLEDVYVDERHRGQGFGSELVQAVIKAAKQHHCYKLIATSRKSREKVHELYQKLGFEDYGVEFRMNL
jgi:GNAT superfamily N-acetyltransferase